MGRDMRYSTQVRHCARTIHSMKSVQIRHFFWSVFFRIPTEYVKIQTRKNSVFGHFSHSAIVQNTCTKIYFQVKIIIIKKSSLHMTHGAVVQRCFEELLTMKNTVISPNFLVWKFCGKVQFPHSFGQFARNHAETVPFHKIYTPGN